MVRPADLLVVCSADRGACCQEVQEVHVNVRNEQLMNDNELWLVKRFRGSEDGVECCGSFRVFFCIFLISHTFQFCVSYSADPSLSGKTSLLLCV